MLNKMLAQFFRQSVISQVSRCCFLLNTNVFSGFVEILTSNLLNRVGQIIKAAAAPELNTELGTLFVRVRQLLLFLSVIVRESIGLL